MKTLFATLGATLVVGLCPNASLAQNLAAAPDHPSVTVKGQTYNPRTILARNMGTPEDQSTAFPPHKIIGNLYYVGTRTLSSFLVVTPQGNILIDSTYERNVPTIRKSVSTANSKAGLLSSKGAAAIVHTLRNESRNSRSSTPRAATVVAAKANE